MISTDNDLMPAIYTQESAKSRALRALRAFVGHVPSWVHKNSRWSKKNSRGSKKKSQRAQNYRECCFTFYCFC